MHDTKELKWRDLIRLDNLPILEHISLYTELFPQIHNIHYGKTTGHFTNFSTRLLFHLMQWRIQDFEKGGSTPTQMHGQALPV